jgi:hypothetical protein
MSRKDGDGTCEACHRSFAYYLIHNGFNDSSYAYCASCGLTALLDVHSAPQHAAFGNDRRITPDVATLLAPCRCGGRFDAVSAPRCPHCAHELSARAAASWIEANAAANAPRRRRWWSRWLWRWQQDWGGLYAIVIEDRLVQNPWRPKDPHPDA